MGDVGQDSRPNIIRLATQHARPGGAVRIGNLVSDSGNISGGSMPAALDIGRLAC